jgi:hypothetical protein
VFCPQCIYVFCTDLITISDYFSFHRYLIGCIYLGTNSDLCNLQHKLIGFYNRDEKCLQRGTDWVFKQSGLRFVFKGLKSHYIISPIYIYIYIYHVSYALYVTLVKSETPDLYSGCIIYVFVCSCALSYDGYRQQLKHVVDLRNGKFVFWLRKPAVLVVKRTWMIHSELAW